MLLLAGLELLLLLLPPVHWHTARTVDACKRHCSWI
jgi:hypothetical protein